MDISGEVSKLQASYNMAIQRRDEAKKQLAQAISEQQLIKWELEHEKRRTKDYEKQTDRIRMEIAALKSHMPMMSESRSFFFFFYWFYVLSGYKYMIIDRTNNTSCLHFLW